MVKAMPASPPMIVPMAEGSGTVVLSAPVWSRKDEMTKGGLYVIDGIDGWWRRLFPRLQRQQNIAVY